MIGRRELGRDLKGNLKTEKKWWTKYLSYECHIFMGNLFVFFCVMYSMTVHSLLSMHKKCCVYFHQSFEIFLRMCMCMCDYECVIIYYPLVGGSEICETVRRANFVLIVLSFTLRSNTNGRLTGQNSWAEFDSAAG